MMGEVHKDGENCRVSSFIIWTLGKNY